MVSINDEVDSISKPYSRLPPATTKLYAECYYARRDLLVLEDLSAAHLGYRHLASDEPYTNRHCKLFLTHLAQLHTGSIAWEEKEGINIGKRFADSLFELMLITENEWYVTGAKVNIRIILNSPLILIHIRHNIGNSSDMYIVTIKSVVDDAVDFRIVKCNTEYSV